MVKRKRREQDAGDPPVDGQEANGEHANGSQDRLRSAVFGGRNKLHTLELACKQLSRIKDPGPEHVHKFIERVFGIAGVPLS